MVEIVVAILTPWFIPAVYILTLISIASFNLVFEFFLTLTMFRDRFTNMNRMTVRIRLNIKALTTDSSVTLHFH